MPTDTQRRLRLGAAHGQVDGRRAAGAWRSCCRRARCSAAASKARSASYLLEHDLVEAVIGLAPNLFYGTGLAACILVLRRRKRPERAGKVLIVDAATLFRKGRAQNFLELEHAATILGWVQAFADVADRAAW